MKMTYVFINIVFALLYSCNEGDKEKMSRDNINGMRNETICGNYAINNLESTIVIVHYESTETLDASVDSGIINIAPSIIEQSQKLKNPSCISASDLKLSGISNIKEVLFGDSINYGELWNNKYLVKGKIIGIYKYGLDFRVDSYKYIGKK